VTVVVRDAVSRMDAVNTSVGVVIVSDRVKDHDSDFDSVLSTDAVCTSVGVVMVRDFV
jgi:hypothetical protein